MDNTYQYGFRELDALTGGLRPGELVLVGGRPGMGKTDFALNLVLRFIKNNYAVTYAVLHDDIAKPMHQLLRLISGVKKGNTICAEEWHRMGIACQLLSQTKCCIERLRYDCEESGVEDLHRLRRRFQAGRCPDVLIIDELRQIEYGKPLEYENFLKCLKSLAKELTIPVIVLANWPIICEKRKNTRPSLTDFCFTSFAPDIFSTILFLYRDHYYNWEADDAMEVIVAKSPPGSKGTCLLKYYWQLGYLDEPE